MPESESTQPAIQATTQRAYTLRLHGPDRDDQSWRDALWATHEAVNKGKVFGDWLLTMRGGLDHALAEEAMVDGRSKVNRAPTAAEIRDKRILLALSWLSVESAPQAGDTHADFIVASGYDDGSSGRSEKVIAALQDVLRHRGVDAAALEEWVDDCGPSLSAAIRRDAVWVNRSAMFDAARASFREKFTRADVWDMLDPFFAGRTAYFALVSLDDAEDVAAAAGEEKAKDLAQKAGGWLSRRMGTGEGANFDLFNRVYLKIGAWAANQKSGIDTQMALRSLASALGEFNPSSADAEGILALISGPGYKSATRNVIGAWKGEPTALTGGALQGLVEASATDAKRSAEKMGGKGRREYSDHILASVAAACGFAYLQAGSPARHGEYSVMLDHAARRVSIVHSWVKRAEAERRSFQGDTEKISSVPVAAKAWLDRFCFERSAATGSLEGYRIRRRAINGWKEVVGKWGRPDCKTENDRIAAVREVQAEGIVEKFGDAQLFEALGTEEAQCVWQPQAKADPQPLLDYFAARDAEAKQKRFKVPAYRHPDPLLHPIFCDFGNSRWGIGFAVHEAASKLAGAQYSFERRKAEYLKAEYWLTKAKSQAEQADARAEISIAKAKLKASQEELEWMSCKRAVSLRLWDGTSLVDDGRLLWSSKKLWADLGFQAADHGEHQDGPDVVSVSRNDRLGRAAVGASARSRTGVKGLFNEKYWNGRLQAPRPQLDAIASHVSRNGWTTVAKKMRGRIRWVISFSPKLCPAGPWFDFAKTFAEADLPRPFVARKGDFAVNHGDSGNRGGLAKLGLSRLRGLRMLSVDLGHRYAAACAVWETLTSEQMAAECVAAGHPLPTESDLFLHLKKQTGKIARNGRRKGQRIDETVIYRRIGDKIGGRVPSPAPWARLDRQFLIKLQGEERAARAALGSETAIFTALANSLGFRFPPDAIKALRVDELMAETVRIARLGLQRHGRRAKIAYAFDPKTQSIPGMGGSEKLFGRGDDAHIEFLTGALADWLALATDTKWEDSSVRNAWNQFVAGPHGAPGVEGPKPGSADEEENNGRQRRKQAEEMRERLRPIALKLAKDDLAEIRGYWLTRWRQDDGNAAMTAPNNGPDSRGKTIVTSPATGWFANLRLIADWISGRRLPGESNDDWRLHVGGLSLGRISTMKSLYQVQKAFGMRATPEKPRGSPEKGESNLGAVRSLLEAMEKMREQRVKQLSSRIAEAALGVGRIRARQLSAGVKRPSERVDPPCHAVVIENLENYRPDEIRTRRENRQLMEWSAGKVRKYLSEACQLNGLHLRQISAGYTSRQDSRTGAPGVRCQDVPAKTFMVAPWWKKQVRMAQKKRDENGGGTARDRYLVALSEKCEAEGAGSWDKLPPLRIPVQGGDLFVSADSSSPAARGIQADLNAAANIGLKALLDPDWPGKWWYVPCESATHKPDTKSTKGSAAIEPGSPLTVASGESPKGEAGGRRKAHAMGGEVVNLWRDPSHLPIQGGLRDWSGYSKYRNDVECRVLAAIQARTADLPSRTVSGIAPDDVPW